MKRLEVKFRDNTINMSLADHGVLTAIISVVDNDDSSLNPGERIELQLGGLDAAERNHPDWGSFDLDSGDTVAVTIHDDRISDPPTRRNSWTEEQEIESQKKYVREMAAKFGWTLNEVT